MVTWTLHHRGIHCDPAAFQTADDHGPDCSFYKGESFKDEKTFV